MASRREPDRDRVRFARAEAWLLALAAPEPPGGPGTSDLGDLLRILFGVWLCERAVGDDARSPDLVALAGGVEQRLCRAVSAGEFDPSAHDATLLLLCHRILSEQGRQAWGISSFAHELSAALGETPTVPQRDAGAAVLLAQLGYRAYPVWVTLPAADIGGDAAALLRADEARVRAVCNAIASATQFGLRPLTADRAVRESLALVLPIILVASLRQNDLETGAAVLRAIRYLRLPRTRAARQATTFVADQQQGDGKFGYLAAETAAIANARGWVPFDAARQLYLPVTVSCLWALAETTIPRFNLVSRAPMAQAGAGHASRQSTAT